MTGWPIDRRRLGLLGLGGAATLAGCGPSHRSVQDGAVRMAFGATIESLDAMMTIHGYPLFRSIFDPLVEVRADGSLGPRLAIGWRANADATQWIFDLRPDARWSDGSPVTLQDVLFTFRTIRDDPASLNHQYMTTVTAIEPAGPTAVRFALKAPFAAWPRQLTLMSIVPRAVYKAMGAQAFSRQPVSSGPYKVERLAPGGLLKLVANPHHAGGPPPFARIDVVSIPDQAARLNALQSGDIDVIDVTPQQAPLLHDRSKVSLISTRSNRAVYLAFVMDEPILRDVRVRRAVDCAIDRDAICRYLLRGSARPLGQLVGPDTFGYDPSVPATAYDPARARALLAAAGYRGQPIVFQYPTDGAIPMVTLVAQAVEGFLSDVGVKVQMRGLEQNTFIGDWLGKKLRGVFLFAFNPSTMDAGLVTGSLINREGVRSFDDAYLDQLEALQQTQTDPKARAATFGRMWAYNKKAVYYAPLFNDSYVYAMTRGKVTMEPRRDGYITAHELKPA